MTVSSTQNRVSYSGNGSTTAFSFPYYFLLTSDLLVTTIDSSGNITTKVLNSDYTVSGTQAANGTYPSGGTVTFGTAPATGLTVMITRIPADTQGTHWVDGDPDSSIVKETAFDKLTLLVQRSWDLITRSVVLPDGYAGSFSNQLPSVLTPNYGLVVNSGGTGWTLAAVSANSGTVTSVGLTTPAEFVAGGNVTTSGNLSFTKANQSANTVWAGPTTGSAAAPGFRALVVADIPTLSLTSLSSGAATNGQVPVANGSGGIAWQSVVGTGTVTSVALAASSEFTITGSPVTTSGTLTIGKATQSPNTFWGGPTSGGGGQPQFRNIVVADLPAMVGATGSVDGSAGIVPAPSAGQEGYFLQGNGTWAQTPQGTVTSVSLAMPAEFSVAGSPLTSSGTLTVTKANQNANLVYAGPGTGSAAAPAFRALVPADIPLYVGATGIASGIAGAVPSAASGEEAYFLRGDGTWSTVGAGTGTVTSVGLSLPADFTVSNSPVTGSGTLTAVWANENANLVHAGPSSGGAAAPTWRALVVADLPTGYVATNLNSGAATNGQVLTANGLGGATWTTLTAGGTVTSVGMTVPSFLNVGGSPITTSGTLAVTLATQAANTVFAGPTSGGNAAPTFRAIVVADLPAMGGASSGSAGTAGIVPAPNAGQENMFLRGDGTWANAGSSSTASTITTNTTASTSVGTYFCNGTLTLTLLAPGGYKWTVKNIGSGTVTVQAASGDIESQTTATLAAGEVFTFEDDGSNYWQVA